MCACVHTHKHTHTKKILINRHPHSTPTCMRGTLEKWGDSFTKERSTCIEFKYQQLWPAGAGGWWGASVPSVCYTHIHTHTHTHRHTYTHTDTHTAPAWSCFPCAVDKPHMFSLSAMVVCSWSSLFCFHVLASVWCWILTTAIDKKRKAQSK